MRPGTLIALDRLAVADGQDVRDLRRRAAAEVLQPTTAYPQQAHVVREVARAPRSTVQANRRAGKTHAIAALIEGRLIHRDNYVVNVLTSVLRNPSKTWLDCADKESFLQRMQRLGLAEYMRVDRRAESIVRVRFAWGSVLSILHIRAIADIEKPDAAPLVQTPTMPG